MLELFLVIEPRCKEVYRLKDIWSRVPMCVGILKKRELGLPLQSTLVSSSIKRKDTLEEMNRVSFSSSRMEGNEHL